MPRIATLPPSAAHSGLSICRQMSYAGRTVVITLIARQPRTPWRYPIG
ncbi:MAG: hypothetical protein ACREEM_07855 [Blastocatellia bacterium]